MYLNVLFVLQYLKYYTITGEHEWPVCPSLTNLHLSIDLSVSLSILGAEKHDSMFPKTISRTIMEVKERRPYSSLSKSRRHKEGAFTGKMIFLAQAFIHDFSCFLPISQSCGSLVVLHEMTSQTGSFSLSADVLV